MCVGGATLHPCDRIGALREPIGGIEMNTYVVAGGNSGIGLQVSREMVAAGHRVIMLGRDQAKGDSAVASLGNIQDRAMFIPVDLSTHQGVREAARKIDAITERIDGIVHSAAVFETRDIRTADALPLFFALSFLSRYHLTQLLLPKLLLSECPRVTMLTAGLKETPKLDPDKFRDFKTFSFMKMVLQVNGGCMYYADYLTKLHPKMFARCVSPGFVQTDLFKNAPWYLRLYVAVFGPFLSNSVQTGAYNVVQATLRGAGQAALNWHTPGNFEQRKVIEVDRSVQNEVLAAAKALTGV